MKILAIETSCDETALSIVEATGGVKKPRFNVLKNSISSQIAIHRPFGGVVPNLAKREHIKNLPKLLRQVFGHLPFAIDAIAVTVGPGLEPALWTGIEFAKELSKKLNVPLLGVNHMEGHLFSILLPQNNSKLITHNLKQKGYQLSVISYKFPAIGLVVSGGHTILVKMTSLTNWKKLGETRDDAAGEAFDKVAKMLGLPYPGGPEISKLAKQGDAKAIGFPRPMLSTNDFDFSFSGLKTAVLYYLRDKGLSTSLEKLRTYEKRSPVRNFVKSSQLVDVADVAASFQQAVLDVLIKKTMRAASQYNANSVFLCGGVAANVELRHQLGKECEKKGVQFFTPASDYNTDNAAMVAVAAYMSTLHKKKYPIKADSNLSL